LPFSAPNHLLRLFKDSSRDILSNNSSSLVGFSNLDGIFPLSIVVLAPPSKSLPQPALPLAKKV
jgi:hypothetical protein